MKVVDFSTTKLHCKCLTEADTRLCPFTQKQVNLFALQHWNINQCHYTKSVKNLKMIFHHNFITWISKLTWLDFEKAHKVFEARPKCYVFVFVWKFFWVILRKTLLGRKIRLGKSQIYLIWGKARIFNGNPCYTYQFLHAYHSTNKIFTAN